MCGPTGHRVSQKAARNLKREEREKKKEEEEEKKKKRRGGGEESCFSTLVQTLEIISNIRVELELHRLFHLPSHVGAYTI